MPLGRRAVVAAVALALTGVAAAPAAGAGDRQSVSSKLTTKLPGTAAGNRFSVQWRDPSDPGAKPPAIDTVVIQLPRGSRYDFSALPQCKASDAELMLQGTAGCPAESQVSTGLTVVDTGSPGGFPRFLHVPTVMFNNQNEMIGIGDTQEIPFRTVVRTKIVGERVTIPIPDNPGGPPDNRSAFKSMQTTMGPIVRGGRAYTRTPPSCPAGGFWTTRYTFIYHDGVRQFERTRSPCLRSANPCLARRATIGRARIGRVRLGRTRAQLRALPVRPPRARRKTLSWCVRGSRGRVRALFGRRGKAVLVLTSARGHGNRGVRPGASSRKVRAAYPRRRRVAPGVLRAGPRSRMLIGLRAGRVRYVAVASRRLLADPGGLLRSLQRVE